ncbi:four helix bundle protein [Algoriphagus iocasae]|jgi:four helix bundle protein|uniref:Four helix bundle protein n=1 Tax=Algoriphagus iocasae TaxID=1836499 RepID=A0A841MPJ2_9BACT|nr:four helix bundle protein [Algoriphagus iocasae]MBB6327489.1 four helix bundle protein [Algoriphagus iocasae]
MEYRNSFKFEKLIIWQKAMELGEQVHVICKNFPKDELFNLSSQFKRATDSIALNISEGAILQSNLEQKKFIGYAIRSLAEVITCLYKAINRKYLNDSVFDKMYKDCQDLMNMMIAFRKNIK